MAPQPTHLANIADTLTRRGFLAGLAGAAVLGACTTGPSSDSPEVENGEATGTEVMGGSATVGFQQPEVVRSRDGHLEVTLTAAPATFGGALSGTLAYDNAPVGPTLRVRPGDRINLTLRNSLGVPTNLHTHGLNVSPSGQGDNVFATIAAGEERIYVYNVPSTHRSGTFWYHPHLHGSVAAQVAAGLFGVIIVDDEIDDRADMQATTERLFVLNDPIGIDRALSPMDGMHGRAGEAVRVNGVDQPVLTGAPGGLERWRLVNASASRPLALSIPDVALHLIASDGGRLATTREVGGLVLVPGERAEVIFEIPSTSGQLAVGDDGAGRPLAFFEPTASPSLPAATVPDGLGVEVSIDALRVARQRTLTFGSDMGSMMSDDSGLQFTIDGHAFDPQRTDVQVRADAIEEWRLVNTTGMDHPFHLHAWPFEVLGDNAWPGWKDTVNVPGGGEIVIRIPFVGQTGRSVYHCHILDHEDLGMMGVIDVQPS